MNPRAIYLLAWIHFGYFHRVTIGTRPQFDTSTDMGLVLVPADAEVDSVIFRLRATDQDADFPLVFEITAAVQPIVRVVNLPCTLYNKVCQANVILTRRLVPGRLHDFAVRVKDSKGDSNSMQATISVTNATTPRDMIFPHVPSIIMVPEDTKPGKELDYLLVRANPWSGKPVYIELWQPKELFTVRQRQTPVETRGVIMLTGELDFETQSMYTLTMYATDPYTEPGKDTRNIAGIHVVVIVQDVQDVPPVFTIAPPLTRVNNSIKPGDVILRVHAEDGDKGTPREVTYGLVSENNPFTTFFNISESTGEIILARPLEELTRITHVGAPIILNIVAEEVRRSRDEPPGQATEVELGILLGEPGNSPPYFESTSYVAWMDENSAPGSVVAFDETYSTRVVDEDLGKTGVFALKLDNNNGTFEVAPAVAERSADFVLTVRNNSLMDYETSKSLVFSIIAQEVGPATNLSASVSVTIFLRDVNDNPPEFEREFYEATLSENVASGTRVVQVHAVDKDTGIFGKFKYSRILGPGSESLVLDPESGWITVAQGAILDREIAASLNLSIEARDENGKGLKSTVPLIVNLLDVNDNAPIFENSVYEFALNSDHTNFSSPAFVKAIDADAESPNNDVRYELVHGNYENKFYLNEVTGELTLREALNKLRRPRHDAYERFAAKFRNNFLHVQKTFERLSVSTKRPLRIWKNRKKRADDDALYTLTVRAYDLGVPHRSSTAQVRVTSGVANGPREVMFVVPGENPDRAKTTETLATITGGRVTIKDIRPYNETADTGSEKKSIVVALVEQNGPGTWLVDVDKIRKSLAANGVGIIAGMETSTNSGSGNSQSGNSGKGNSGSGNSGNSNSGNGASGNGNFGNGNSGNGNSGNGNSENGNSGNGNSGNGNFGSGNSGNSNAGSGNSESGNSGRGNSGSGNSGNSNSGNGASGNGNSGNGNSGNGNSGNGNSGNGNSGNGNFGSGNSGNSNSGSGNSVNGNSGSENFGNGKDSGDSGKTGSGSQFGGGVVVKPGKEVDDSLPSATTSEGNGGDAKVTGGEQGSPKPAIIPVGGKDGGQKINVGEDKGHDGKNQGSGSTVEGKEEGSSAGSVGGNSNSINGGGTVEGESASGGSKENSGNVQGQGTNTGSVGGGNTVGSGRPVQETVGNTVLITPVGNTPVGNQPSGNGIGTSGGVQVVGGSTNVNSNSINKTVTTVVQQDEVIVYRAENKLLMWLLILLGLLMLAALLALILCCICPGCPFYMAPRKRRVHSVENVMRIDGRPQRHLRRKQGQQIDAEWAGKKQAWSAEPTRRNWQFNKRNTRNRGLASLPGDVAAVHEPYLLSHANSLRLRDGPALRDRSVRRAEKELLYVEDVETGRVFDPGEADSLRRHEMERGSDIPARVYRYVDVDGEPGQFPREQVFYRDGNAEVLRLVTRGPPPPQVEEAAPRGQRGTTLIDLQPGLQGYRIDGKDILLRRFMEDQALGYQDAHGSVPEIRLDSFESRRHDGQQAMRKPEVVLDAGNLDRDGMRFVEEQGTNVQRLVIEHEEEPRISPRTREGQHPGYQEELILQEQRRAAAAMMVGALVAKASEKSAANARSLQGREERTVRDIELSQRGATRGHLLAERESGHLGVVGLDAGSYLETQSLPGQIAIATQTDRTASTQTDNYHQARSRSDNDESEEESRTRKKSRSKRRAGTELRRSRSLWVQSPIEEESWNTERGSGLTRRRGKESKSNRRATLEPEVLREISDSLEERTSTPSADECGTRKTPTRTLKTKVGHPDEREEPEEARPSSPDEGKDKYHRRSHAKEALQGVGTTAVALKRMSAENRSGSRQRNGEEKSESRKKVAEYREDKRYVEETTKKSRKKNVEPRDVASSEAETRKRSEERKKTRPKRESQEVVPEEVPRISKSREAEESSATGRRQLVRQHRTTKTGTESSDLEEALLGKSKSISETGNKIDATEKAKSEGRAVAKRIKSTAPSDESKSKSSETDRGIPRKKGKKQSETTTATSSSGSTERDTTTKPMESEEEKSESKGKTKTKQQQPGILESIAKLPKKLFEESGKAIKSLERKFEGSSHSSKSDGKRTSKGSSRESKSKKGSDNSDSPVTEVLTSTSIHKTREIIDPGMEEVRDIKMEPRPEESVSSVSTTSTVRTVLKNPTDVLHLPDVPKDDPKFDDDDERTSKVDVVSSAKEKLSIEGSIIPKEVANHDGDHQQSTTVRTSALIPEKYPEEAPGAKEHLIIEATLPKEPKQPTVSSLVGHEEIIAPIDESKREQPPVATTQSRATDDEKSTIDASRSRDVEPSREVEPSQDKTLKEVVLAKEAMITEKVNDAKRKIEEKLEDVSSKASSSLRKFFDLDGTVKTSEEAEDKKMPGEMPKNEMNLSKDPKESVVMISTPRESSSNVGPVDHVMSKNIQKITTRTSEGLKSTGEQLSEKIFGAKDLLSKEITKTEEKIRGEVEEAKSDISHLKAIGDSKITEGKTLVNEASKSVDKFTSEKLKSTGEQVSEKISGAKDLLSKEIAKTEEKIRGEVEEAKSDISHLKAIGDSKITEGKTLVNEASKSVDKFTSEKLKSTGEQVSEKISGAKDLLSKEIAKTEEKIRGEVEEAKSDISHLKAIADSKITEGKTLVNEALKSVDKFTSEKLKSTGEQVSEKISGVKDLLSKEIGQTEDKIRGEVEEVKSDISKLKAIGDSKITEGKMLVNEASNSVDKFTSEKLKSAGEQLSGAKDLLSKEIGKTEEKIRGEVEEVKSDISKLAAIGDAKITEGKTIVNEVSESVDKLIELPKTFTVSDDKVDVKNVNNEPVNDKDDKRKSEDKIVDHSQNVESRKSGSMQGDPQNAGGIEKDSGIPDKNMESKSSLESSEIIIESTLETRDAVRSFLQEEMMESSRNLETMDEKAKGTIRSAAALVLHPELFDVGGSKKEQRDDLNAKKVEDNVKPRGTMMEKKEDTQKSTIEDANNFEKGKVKESVSVDKKNTKTTEEETLEGKKANEKIRPDEPVEDMRKKDVQKDKSYERDGLEERKSEKKEDEKQQLVEKKEDVRQTESNAKKDAPKIRDDAKSVIKSKEIDGTVEIMGKIIEGGKKVREEEDLTPNLEQRKESVENVDNHQGKGNEEHGKDAIKTGMTDHPMGEKNQREHIAEREGKKNSERVDNVSVNGRMKVEENHSKQTLNPEAKEEKQQQRQSVPIPRTNDEKEDKKEAGENRESEKAEKKDNEEIERGEKDNNDDAIVAVIAEDESRPVSGESENLGEISHSFSIIDHPEEMSRSVDDNRRRAVISIDSMDEIRSTRHPEPSAPEESSPPGSSSTEFHRRVERDERIEAENEPPAIIPLDTVESTKDYSSSSNDRSSTESPPFYILSNVSSVEGEASSPDKVKRSAREPSLDAKETPKRDELGRDFNPSTEKAETTMDDGSRPGLSNVFVPLDVIDTIDNARPYGTPRHRSRMDKSSSESFDTPKVSSSSPEEPEAANEDPKAKTLNQPLTPRRIAEEAIRRGLEEVMLDSKTPKNPTKSRSRSRKEFSEVSGKSVSSSETNKSSSPDSKKVTPTSKVRAKSFQVVKRPKEVRDEAKESRPRTEPKDVPESSKESTSSRPKTQRGRLPDPQAQKSRSLPGSNPSPDTSVSSQKRPTRPGEHILTKHGENIATKPEETAKEGHMSRYKRKREEMERKRRERKELAEAELRPRWQRKTWTPPQPVKGPTMKETMRETTREVTRITTREITTESSTPTSQRDSLPDSESPPRRTVRRVKPLENPKSEELREIVKRGRRMRKTEGGDSDDPPVEIFASRPPTLKGEREERGERDRGMAERQEWQNPRYSDEPIPLPFYLHPPPPVPNPSPVPLSPDRSSSDFRRHDDDLDSGIAVSLQGGTKPRHQQLLEKKSVFDIAYNDAAPSQLRSDSTTPPS